MRRIVMVTLAVLPWVLAVVLSFAVSWGFFHIQKQNKVIIGMARAVVNLGALYTEQDKRIDGFDGELPGIYHRDADLGSQLDLLVTRLEILEKKKKTTDKK